MNSLLYSPERLFSDLDAVDEQASSQRAATASETEDRRLATAIFFRVDAMDQRAAIMETTLDKILTIVESMDKRILTIEQRWLTMSSETQNLNENDDRVVKRRSVARPSVPEGKIKKKGRVVFNSSNEHTFAFVFVKPPSTHTHAHNPISISTNGVDRFRPEIKFNLVGKYYVFVDHEQTQTMGGDWQCDAGFVHWQEAKGHFPYSHSHFVISVGPETSSWPMNLSVNVVKSDSQVSVFVSDDE
jgi:hypothetical protein